MTRPAMSLDEAVAWAATEFPDVAVLVTESSPAFTDPPGGEPMLAVMAETVVGGQKYAAWQTIETPQALVTRLVRQAREAAA